MREFIDKVKAKGIIASGKDDKAYFGSTSNDWKVIDFLNEVPIVNEQEIVKPYLDKLKEEINKLKNANPSYWHQCDVVDREDVIDMIDNILSEQEKAE